MVTRYFISAFCFKDNIAEAQFQIDLQNLGFLSQLDPPTTVMKAANKMTSGPELIRLRETAEACSRTNHHSASFPTSCQSPRPVNLLSICLSFPSPSISLLLKPLLPLATQDYYKTHLTLLRSCLPLPNLFCLSQENTFLRTSASY